MRALPQASRRLGQQNIPRSTAGMSLVEVMVVVTIISMMFTMAVPAYLAVQRKARAAALTNNFRVFAAVFQAHAHEYGTWPPEVAAGVMPAGFTSQELKPDSWTRPTIIGGKFDWEYLQTHPGGTTGGKWLAAIAITDAPGAPVLIDLQMFQLIDAAIDDGNLNTGSFRLGNANCPIYILEP